MDVASWTVVVTSTSNHVPDKGETHDGQSDRGLRHYISNARRREK